MKKALCLFTILVVVNIFIGCGVGEIPASKVVPISKLSYEKDKIEFVYIHSKETGLCYAFSSISVKASGDKIVQYSYPDGRTMVCVPCDSLKNVKVIEVN